MLDTQKFSAALFSARSKKNISQSKLAAHLGIERTNIIRYEQGTLPHINNFYKLCKWLGKPMESFFTSK